MNVFDRDASTYDEWYATPLGRYADEAETRCALNLFKVFRGMKILDVGCGTGNFSLKLARKGCQVTGIDLSEKMLSLARKKAKEEGLPVIFCLMDAADLQFRNETFDGVISMTSFEFMEEPEKTMKEMLRVLKKGGSLLIGTINRESSWGEMYLSAGEKKESVFSHARLKTLDELKTLEAPYFVAAEECLFIPPDLEDEKLKEIAEGEAAEKGRGGFLCALWRKA